MVGADGGYIMCRAQDSCVRLIIGKKSTLVRVRERLCGINFNTDFMCEDRLLNFSL